MIAAAHTHTEYSDGTQSHRDILAAAEQLDIKAIVFSDHDLLIPDEAMSSLDAYDGPTVWYSGIELTTHFSPAPGAKAGTLHLLGIGVDRTHRALQAYCRQLQADRLKTMRGTVKHLRALGFDISEAKVLEKIGKATAVSPHFIAALELDSNQHNAAVHQRLLDELATKATGGNKRARALYEQWQSDGPKQEPYILYMKNHSFRPANASVREHQLDIVESCRLIREAGGKAVLAHWFFNKDALPAEQLERLVADGHFDGLETNVINTISGRDVSSDIAYLKSLAADFQLPTICTPDSHSHADMLAFVASPDSKGSAKALRTLLAE